MQSKMVPSGINASFQSRKIIQIIRDVTTQISPIGKNNPKIAALDKIIGLILPENADKANIRQMKVIIRKKIRLPM